jgi:methylglyoxal synthase
MTGNVTQLLRADTPRPVVALVAHDCRKDEMVEWAKALLRLAVLYDVPIACNRSSADYMIVEFPPFRRLDGYVPSR